MQTDTVQSVEESRPGRAALILRAVIRRAAIGLLTILLVVILSSLLIYIVPGDPVMAMSAQAINASPEMLDILREQLGLNDPIPVQIFRYVVQVLQGDLGTTIRGKESVANLLLQRLPNTIALASAGLSIALVIGIPLGFVAAINRGRAADAVVMVIAVLGVSIPAFWLGLMMINTFSLQLGWFPIAGTGPMHIVLPALTLGLVYSALVARMTRSALVDILNEDYIRTARARGLRESQVLFVHAFRPALIVIITIVGLVFAHLLGGQVIVENVFSWNGIGRVAIQAMLERDYPLIQGFMVIFSAMIVLVSIFLEIVYGLLDPRMRVE